MAASRASEANCLSDFAVSGTVLAPVNPRLFESFGQPRTSFDAEAVAEDTEAGRKAVAAFEAAEKNYNDAVTKLDKRTGTDRAIKNTTGLVDKGLMVFDKVSGRNGGGETGKASGGGLAEVFGAVTAAAKGDAPATPAAEQVSKPAAKAAPAKPAFDLAGALAGALRGNR